MVKMMNQTPKKPSGERRAANGRTTPPRRPEKETANAARRAARSGPTKRELARQEQQKKLEEKKQKQKKIYRARFLTFLVIFGILLLLSVAIFFLNLHHYEKPGFKSYTVHVGSDDTRGSSVAYDKMMRDGTLYVNLTPVSELCEMVVTGDTAELRFSSGNDSGENVLFILGTCEVYLNGTAERLTAPSVLEDDDVYVPYDFLANYVGGLRCTYNEEKHEISIVRAVNAAATEYEPVSFLLKSGKPMAPMDETANFGDSSPMDLKTNTAAFEEFINPADRDGYLTVVNKDHPIGNETPSDLVDVKYCKPDGRPTRQMRKTAEMACEALFGELRANAFSDCGVTVGFISYDFQNLYYQQDNSNDAPGTNDTILGLSFKIDLNSKTSENFGKTDLSYFLEENAWKFGFVLRYPADKVNVTGFPYTPNQYRFVGRYHAMRMHFNGMCLEEYVAYLHETGYLPPEEEPAPADPDAAGPSGN